MTIADRVAGFHRDVCPDSSNYGWWLAKDPKPRRKAWLMLSWQLLLAPFRLHPSCNLESSTLRPPQVPGTLPLFSLSGSLERMLCKPMRHSKIRNRYARRDEPCESQIAKDGLAVKPQSGGITGNSRG